MILVTCASKLTLSIFFVGAFVLAQFWAIASIISWSVKKLIFLMKIVKMGDFVSVISPWKRSPRLKFGGPKRASQTGQEDGWENKRKKSFLRGKFCCAKSPFFSNFFNFWAVFAIFWLFLGHFWVDTRYVGWIPGCQQLNGSNCSIFFVFHCHFWQFFFVIFGNFLGFIAILLHFVPFCLHF